MLSRWKETWVRFEGALKVLWRRCWSVWRRMEVRQGRGGHIAEPFTSCITFVGCRLAVWVSGHDGKLCRVSVTLAWYYERDLPLWQHGEGLWGEGVCRSLVQWKLRVERQEAAAELLLLYLARSIYLSNLKYAAHTNTMLRHHYIKLTTKDINNR